MSSSWKDTNTIIIRHSICLVFLECVLYVDNEDNLMRQLFERTFVARRYLLSN